MSEPTTPTVTLAITRKSEKRATTDLFNTVIGYYLAEDAVITHRQDFADESTGGIVTVDRCELIAQRGTLITPDIAQSLNFHKLAGDITAVTMSNQRRKAKPKKSRALQPYRVNATIGRKRYSFILQAVSPTAAVEVATDHIELNYNHEFIITMVKRLEHMIILNETLVSVEDAAAAAQAIALMGEDNKPQPDARYYKIEADVTLMAEDADPEHVHPSTECFIVQTKDVHTAEAAVIAWLDNLAKRRSKSEGKNYRVANFTLLEAAPFSCNEIISRDFCLAYSESEPAE